MRLNQVVQPLLPVFEAEQCLTPPEKDRASNQLAPQDRAFHNWYHFVLAFPPHLVRRYIEDFGLDERHCVLDPFCGTGTTLVEAKLHNISAVGVEVNPFAHFASSVKVDWDVDPDALMDFAHKVGKQVLEALRQQGIEDAYPFCGDIRTVNLQTLETRAAQLLIKDSISPLPLHKALVLLDFLKEYQDMPYYKCSLLALADVLVSSASNLRFGPEVGIGKLKEDAPVIGPWLSQIGKMADDLRSVAGLHYPETTVYRTDARHLSTVIPPEIIDAVITSPPYPNEKDYTRTTRLETVVLGLMHSKADLKAIKQTFLCSNTRTVYKSSHDDVWLKQQARDADKAFFSVATKIGDIANEIEQRRVALGKTSGFERLYARVVWLYFGGMARHLADLRSVLRPGAQLAYVVGDQASYFRITIRTGQLLGEIAAALGYEVVRIDLFRTRFATATQEQLREEVVVLRWPG